MKIFQYDNFNEDAKKIENNFLYVQKEIGLNNTWSKKDCFQIEIKKSFIKSVIRYSNETRGLLNLIVKSFAKTNSHDFKYTNLYPMIHLSNDQAESGGYHFDQVDNNNLITLWIAISKYEYAPLSVLYFSFKNVLINKILVKSNIAKYFSKKLYFNQGDLNLWDGKLIHSGNLNSSTKPAMALQMKILPVNTDFIFEDTQEYSIKSIFREEQETKPINYLKDFNTFSLFVNKVNELSNSEEEIFNFKKIIGLIKIFFKYPNKEFSFSLSILSQRIRSFNYLYYSQFKNIEKFTTLLDYSSIIIGSENLVSFKRLYLNINDKNFLLENIIKNDLYDVFRPKEKKINAIIKLIK